jgi:hypothetical protein
MEVLRRDHRNRTRLPYGDSPGKIPHPAIPHPAQRYRSGRFRLFGIASSIRPGLRRSLVDCFE